MNKKEFIENIERMRNNAFEEKDELWEKAKQYGYFNHANTAYQDYMNECGFIAALQYVLDLAYHLKECENGSK